MKLTLKAVLSTQDGVEHARVQYRRTDGAMVEGRFVGWKNTGFVPDPPRETGKAPEGGHFTYELMPEGEVVEVTPANRNDYIRAVRRGDLELLEGEF